MPLEQLANIAEIFGMIVIMVTLVFLTIQMRQNTAALKSAATREAHAQYAQIYRTLMTNDAVRDTLVKGLHDPAALTETEMSRFFSFWMVASINIQNWVHQTKSGAMDPELLNSYSEIIKTFLGTPGWNVFWEERGHAFSPMTQHYIKELTKSGSNRQYRPLGVS